LFAAASARSGLDRGRDRLRGPETSWLNGFSLAGTFEGEFSGVTRSYAGKSVVCYAW
jgi:hypothetical protein